MLLHIAEELCPKLFRKLAETGCQWRAISFAVSADDLPSSGLQNGCRARAASKYFAANELNSCVDVWRFLMRDQNCGESPMEFSFQYALQR